jgi:hypothetical protein
MKNKILSLFLIIALLFASPLTAFAEGDGNIDNGGGGMGNGTSQNSWTPGNDGSESYHYRCTNRKACWYAYRLYKPKPIGQYIVHFGKKSKIHYRDGSQLSPVMGSYQYHSPAVSLPRIISSGSVSASIEAIKKYFCSDGRCSDDCQ